jgi:glycosyltransferase involved in cell wall biosynthesis
MRSIPLRELPPADAASPEVDVFGGRPMGIAHVVRETCWGGMEARTIETAQWQAASGHRVIVVTPEHGRTFAEAERRGLRAVHIDFDGPDKLGNLRAMRRTIRGHGIDVADVHTNRSLAIAIKGMCALVRSQHNLKKKPPRGLRLNREFPFEHFITTSHAARERLSAGGQVRAARISVVGEWAAERFFAPTASYDEAMRRRAGLDIVDFEHVIGACAMLRDDNAFDDLIRATALLRGRGLDVACLIAGGPALTGAGPCAQEAELRALARDLGVAEAVKFLGHRCDVPELFDAMDVATVVSRHTAQTRVAPEAAARGRPVVGFAVGALPEAVRPGDTGALAAPGDIYGFTREIERLLRDRRERERLSANAAAFARRDFRQAPKMEQTLAAYRRVLARPEPGRAPAPDLHPALRAVGG